MSWDEGVVAGLALLAYAVTAVAAAHTSRLARAAFKQSDASLMWERACRLASWQTHATVLLLSAVLFVLSDSWAGNDVATELPVAFLVGVLGGAFLERVKSGTEPYWATVESSLESALDAACAEQRTCFNQRRVRLRLGSDQRRREALQIILRGCKDPHGTASGARVPAPGDQGDSD